MRKAKIIHAKRKDAVHNKEVCKTLESTSTPAANYGTYYLKWWIDAGDLTFDNAFEIAVEMVFFCTAHTYNIN